jgi:outer membrane protein assembly factor BamD (BamD/ComL family)
VLRISLTFIFISNSYAFDLDGIKANFLNGDYKTAITDGEKMMAEASHDEPGIDELYYILGLSYLEDGNYLRASDIFEIILEEFKASGLKEEAELGLGDTYFLRGDFNKAQDCYKRIISENPRTKIRASVFYRLAQTGFKKGDTGQGRDYLEKLKIEFPASLELMQNKDLCILQAQSAEIYYAVQVGSFSDANNAENIIRELTSKGYDAYMAESGAKMFRVKVGKFKTLQEAAQTEAKLSGEGYPTKICP